MKFHHHHQHHHHYLFLAILTFLSIHTSSASNRRVLHHPLYPETDPSSPPPDTPTSSTPYLNPYIPFSPEAPNPDQPTTTTPSPPSTPNGSAGAVPVQAIPQPTKNSTKLAIAISVGIVCLGMLSALVFFLLRHRAKQSSDAQKLVDGRNERGIGVQNNPQSNFLYIETVEPSSRRFVTEEENGANHLPKLNSAEKSDGRYRPSPELQPLPPLVRPLSKRLSRSVMSGSSEDDESLDTSFYTPKESLSDIAAYSCNNKNVKLLRPGGNEENNKSIGGSIGIPHSRRTSPKSNLHPPSPPPMPVMIPSIKSMSSQQDHKSEDKSHQRPRFPAPTPQPNLTLIPSLSYKQLSPSRKSHVPPPTSTSSSSSSAISTTEKIIATNRSICNFKEFPTAQEIA